MLADKDLAITDVTRGRPSNEISRRSKFSMEDPTYFSHQKTSKSSKKEFSSILGIIYVLY